MVKVTAFHKVALPECAIVRPSNNCLSSGQSFSQNSHSLVSPQKPHKSGHLGMKEGEAYLPVDESLYEQGGSSHGVRGLQGGTVLKERKAKMEGS